MQRASAFVTAVLLGMHPASCLVSLLSPVCLNLTVLATVLCMSAYIVSFPRLSEVNRNENVYYSCHNGRGPAFDNSM